MELNREELLSFMGDFDKEAKNKSIEEQNIIIIQKTKDVLNYLNYRSPYDNYSLDRRKRFLTGRQINTMINALRCAKKKELLNAYWEIWDFIDNYSDRTEPILNVAEFDVIDFLLNEIIK